MAYGKERPINLLLAIDKEANLRLKSKDQRFCREMVAIYEDYEKRYRHASDA